MSTHVPGFQSFFQSEFLHYFILAKLTTSCIRVKMRVMLMMMMRKEEAVLFQLALPECVTEVRGRRGQQVS